MKVMLFGASGMVGAGVLIECLEDPHVTAVLSVGRTPLAVQHVKLSEQLTKDLYDVESLRGLLAGYDACFFCLGTLSAGMNEADYRRITYDLTLGIARALAELNPAMTFTYVSGEGTDSTEKGRRRRLRCHRSDLSGAQGDRRIAHHDLGESRPGDDPRRRRGLRQATSRKRRYQRAGGAAALLVPLFTAIASSTICLKVS
jgi:nucleoside-diphosphate-sugar epimerase